MAFEIDLSIYFTVMKPLVPKKRISFELSEIRVETTRLV